MEQTKGAYYSEAKNDSDIQKFAYKWMELIKNILSEKTQTQEHEHCVYSFISGCQL